jgi:hypothetical protein
MLYSTLGSKVATISSGQFPWRQEGAEILADDWYPDWGARSVAPEVVLTWTDGNLKLDTAAMKKKALLAARLPALKLAIAEQFRSFSQNPSSGDVNRAPPELANIVFDLYYCGMRDLAHKFYDSSWPKGRPGKQAYWLFLMNELDKSRYWPKIKMLNTTEVRQPLP